MGKYLIILSTFILLSSHLVFGQENSKSDSIKWIDGNKFYIHTVAKGQGLYSIKRIYSVNEKDILENNPEAFDGLKAGQFLKIPFIKVVPKDLGYRTHVIKAGESIYSISKIYGISPEDIFTLNPEAQNGYKINQKLKIPLEKEAELPQETDSNNNKKEEEDKGSAKKYKVKKKDTLYALAKKFDTTEAELLRLNPIIKEEGLQKGQKIDIPRKEKIIPEALYIPLDTLKIDNNILNDTIPCDSLKTERFGPMNIGLFLPFEMDKMRLEKELANEQKAKVSSKPFIEYYQGFLLAINKLKKDGLDLNIHIFNTKRDSNEIKRILKKSIIQDLDLIIGPVYKFNFEIVQKATDSMAIPMINPIIKETNTYKNSSYTIDMFATNNIIKQKTIELISKNDSSSIFFVYSGFVDDLVISQPFFEAYKEYLLENGKDTTYKELIFQDSKKMSFKPFLNEESNNLIIVLSDNQAFVSNVASKLNAITDDYQIQIIARPKWSKYTNIDVSYLHHLNTLQIKDDYIDYTNKAVINFIKLYKKHYYIEPSKYAMYAYDQTLNFTRFFYSTKAIKCIDNINFDGLIFKYDMQKTTKGWVNHGTFILEYNSKYERILFVPKMENKNTENIKGSLLDL